MQNIHIPEGVHVRVSTRARRMQLVAKTGKGVELVLPVRPPSKRAIQRFLASRIRWIEQQQAKFKREHTSTQLQHGSVLPWEGRDVDLKLIQGSTTNAERTEEGILLSYKPNTTDSKLEEALRELYRVHARAVLTEEVCLFARDQNVKPGSISIRNQKTLWGSCSASGNLSFNWRLMAMPPEVRQYIVHHELAHLVWRNHGKGFWARVESHVPKQKTHRAWLRHHGSQLLQLLREGTVFRIASEEKAQAHESTRA